MRTSKVLSVSRTFTATLSAGLIIVPTLLSAEPDTLPGTRALDYEGNLPDLLMDGAHRFVERRIAMSPSERQKLWKRNFASRKGYESSVSENRARLATSIGVVDSRRPPAMEKWGDDANPALVAETDLYRIYQVRWPVTEDVSQVSGEGLLLTPVGRVLGYVVAVPDAVGTPEDIAGLTERIPAERQYARRLAEIGFEVVVPVIIDRSQDFSGNPRISRTNKPHREWIYHMAYHMGRHPIGYDVQRVLAAIDWFSSRRTDGTRIGVIGHGEGALVAFYAAALDTRIDATLVSGYFEARELVWKEPIYRNVWALLHEFGDAEIASLIAPRSLVIEHSKASEVQGKRTSTGDLAANDGHRAGGRVRTPSLGDVRSEFDRIGTLVPEGFQERILIYGENGATVGPASDDAVRQFANFLGAGELKLPGAVTKPIDRRKSPDPRERQRRQVKQAENHVQWLLRNADATRDRFFLRKVARRDLAKFQADVEKHAYRRVLSEEIFGRIHDQRIAPDPRSRQVYDRPLWTGYELVIDVLPDVIAYGILLLPKDLKPGERRPVVVCQHGRNGIPRDVIEGDQNAYHDFAAKLADRGFVVFAPHNLYRTEQRYRWLDRKANGVKLSMFSFIVVQHEQIVDWLETLSFVDPARIAFYGLSYGGETAVRVPQLIEKYCLSICSADFNDWARRVADAHNRYGYPFADEWEMPYFNMGNTFNYAELSYLMVPRPFMVERGHNDGVAPDEWVAYEFAKVRRLYTQLGIGDRAEIEYFDGPHTIHGVGTFAFLHKHLRWPE